MANQVPNKLVLSSPPGAGSQQSPVSVCLYKADGVTPQVIPGQAVAQANFAGADVTALKVELNAFLTKLRDAGIVLP